MSLRMALLRRLGQGAREGASPSLRRALMEHVDAGAGLMDRTLRRMGGAIPVRSGARDIDLYLMSNGGIDWRWADSGLDRPAGLTNREAAQAFSDVADRVRDEIGRRFPREYSFMGQKGGHGRRYARDLESRLEGTGYRAQRRHDPWFEQDAFVLTPTPQAYFDYFAPRGSDMANAAAIGGLGGMALNALAEPR